jgi:hypothetical protein
MLKSIRHLVVVIAFGFPPLRLTDGNARTFHAKSTKPAVRAESLSLADAHLLARSLYAQSRARHV